MVKTIGMFPTFDFNKMLISQHMFSRILFLQWLQIVFSFLNKHFYFNFFVDFDLNPKLLTRGKPKQRNFCEQKIRIRRFRICENMWWTRYKSAKQRKRMVSMNKSLLLQLVNSEWLPTSISSVFEDLLRYAVHSFLWTLGEVNWTNRKIKDATKS